jgi:hypothetical protein
MMTSRLLSGLLLCLAILACAAQAGAAEPDDKAVSEAKERYARGLYLFQNGDNVGALAEFEQVKEVVPSRLLLYQIAMVYVAMDKPVDAIDSLDEVLSDTGSLKPELLARAKAAKEEQQRRIGELNIQVNVPAGIEIDGERAGDAPLSAPLPVASGDHLVTVVAPGHLPVRQSVTVAAQGRAELTFELLPTDAKLAHVKVYSRLLGAEVRVDDELVGKTPIAEQVTVLPGKRVFEMQRPGYMIARKVLTLGDGVYSAVSFDTEEDSSSDAEHGRLRVAVGTGDVQVTIDDRSLGVYRQPMSLPAGLHVVKLERSGFEPLQRLVEVPANGETEVKVSLRPSGKAREVQAARATAYRTWAIAALASGAVVAGGSLGLALWSNGKLSSAQDSLALTKKDAAPGGTCDPSTVNDVRKQACDWTLADKQGKVDTYSSARLWGIVGTATGAALVGVGVALLLMSRAEPDRDDRDRSLASTLVPVVAADPNGASLSLRGQF